MHMNYTPDGHVSDQLIAFYAERARAGVGLSIVGGMPTCKAAGPFNMPQIKSDEFLPGLTRLAEAMHAAGGFVGVQLYDAGAYSHQMGTGIQARSSSAHVSKFTKEPCREMSKEDIDDAIRNFAEAAERGKRAGLDMAEIIGSAGYLISQFLSPKINKRTDEYGGDMECRMRFGLEVAAAVRDAVGPDYAVGIRLAGNDFVPGSHTNKESAIFAAAVQRYVDMINVTGGWHECSVPQLPCDLPRGAFHYLARGIKRAVDVPVAASNRINNPKKAEWFLANGFSDLICVGRGLIADPEFVAKAKDGRPNDIRPCTGCNQRCFDHVLKLKPIECMVNPIAGHEGKRAIVPTSISRKVMVVGGGVAGCEAAITAAKRGHHVSLYEKSDHVGGQVAWAAEPTHKPEFPTLVAYYERQLVECGVELHFGVAVTPEMVADSDAEVVVIATGAKPLEVPIPGADLDHVVQSWDVLLGKVPVGDRVVIVGGGSVGCETAVWLAQIGCLTPEEHYFLTTWEAETPETLEELLYDGIKQVSVVEQLRKLGKDLGSRRWIVSTKMKKHGVKTYNATKVAQITPEGVICAGEKGFFTLPADTVILALGAASDNALLAACKDLSGKEVVAIGDCVKPSKIPEAIEGGFLAACKI
jgi:2,4-dienoyl-CoA reductase (NADPH2)